MELERRGKARSRYGVRYLRRRYRCKHLVSSGMQTLADVLKRNLNKARFDSNDGIMAHFREGGSRKGTWELEVW